MLAFESKRREEEAHRLFKLRKTIESRTYQRFIAISKLDIRDMPIRNGTISRYGLQIPTSLDEIREKELKDADKFCFMYFKVAIMLLSKGTIEKTSLLSRTLIIRLFFSTLRR
jgi:hypothetical protein